MGSTLFRWLTAYPYSLSWCDLRLWLHFTVTQKTQACERKTQSKLSSSDWDVVPGNEHKVCAQPQFWGEIWNWLSCSICSLFTARVGSVVSERTVPSPRGRGIWLTPGHSPSPGRRGQTPPRATGPSPWPQQRLLDQALWMGTVRSGANCALLHQCSWVLNFSVGSATAADDTEQLSENLLQHRIFHPFSCVSTL